MLKQKRAKKTYGAFRTWNLGKRKFWGHFDYKYIKHKKNKYEAFYLKYATVNVKYESFVTLNIKP